MTAPTVISSSQAFWSKSMASAGHAVTHDLQSEHTAQSRQRSASARTSSSLKPRRTSSHVVRRSTPSRVFMMRRACGSSGSSSVCGILTLSASESHTGISCSPRRKLCTARAPRRPAAIASIAVQGPIAAASPPANTPVRPVIIVSGSTVIWPRATATPSAPVATKSSTIAWPTAKMTVSASSSTNSPSTGTGGRHPRSLGSPKVQRWNFTPVATPPLPRISTGTSEYSTWTCSSLPSSISSDEAGAVRSSSMQARVTSPAPQRYAVRPAS